MSSLPTLPQRSWLERVSLGLEIAVLLCAGATIAGWVLGFDALLQPPRLGSTTFKMNSAVGFLILGGCMIALESGVRRAAVLALIPLAIGGATLVQHAFHVNLGIDELIVRDHLQSNAGHAGRMPAITSLCLLLSSLVVAWYATPHFSRSRRMMTAMIGSLIASAGFSTLVGYAAGLPAVYTWGSGVPTAPVGALTLLMVGIALVSYAWRESTKLRGEPPAWSPLPAIVGCLTLTVILWVGLHQRERSYAGMNTVTAMLRLVTNVQTEIDRQVNIVERMGANVATGASNAPLLWEASARAQWHAAAEKGCRAVGYLDIAGRAIAVYPRENNEGGVGFDHNSLPERKAALDEVRRTGNPTVSATTRITTARTSEPGFVIYAPIMREGQTLGFVSAEFAYHPLFDNIAAREGATGDYQVAASILDATIYSSAFPRNELDHRLARSHSFSIANRRVTLTLTPLPKPSRDTRRYFPELALLAGFGITALFGLSVHLARRATAGQRAAETSNKRLFAENEERRRVEARLKVSDERLRLALDSTQIGIFEWSVPAGHVYYSPALWAMLGYDHAGMPSTMEAWISLIHPDDLPGYRRRIDAQLEGSASFIEPEYRVRAHNGVWRWVYSRSKSVAFSPDGKPLRIVGTLQDITARREAEFALRESQAEARKLSLVAATTDNPVFITSAAGRIEWANEAFCRMTEYALQDVVGKDPAQFMGGPEVNQRSISRIAAALAEGEGTSTDLVHYSKSGRKYHLHVEIQPVRNAAGTLENFIAVETDITARVETENQLRRAKAEADDASRAKSEFLASMSHEIRTPMNGVIGMTSLLMETKLTTEQRDYVNTIRTSGEALLTIINDILDFSKIESGKMELERSPLDLAVCIEDALDLFALQAAAKKLEIGYFMAPDVPNWILGDVTRLRQVLVNLVNNAVKFTPSGSISIEIRRAAGAVPPPEAAPGEVPDSACLMLEFTIRDTGIGIPPERMDRLFRAFSQVDSSTTRKYGGTGLGLAICQRLTQLMGGDIRVEATSDHGSTFVFTIATETATDLDPGLQTAPAALRSGTVLCIEDHPVTQARLESLFAKIGVRCVVAPDANRAIAAMAALPAPPELVVVDGGTLDGAVPLDSLSPTCPRLVLYPFGQPIPTVISNRFPVAGVSKPIRTAPFLQAVTTLFQSAASGRPADAKPADRAIGEEIPLEVLLAEDNPVNQKVALRFLERLGYRADAVANGLEAVTAIENRRYDLVLMDLQMPEMDGFEATRQIRSRVPADRQPKIVALTANAMQGDRDQCVAAGMEDYISKPVKMHEIAAAIRRHFGPPQEISDTRQEN